MPDARGKDRGHDQRSRERAGNCRARNRKRALERQDERTKGVEQDAPVDALPRSEHEHGTPFGARHGRIPAITSRRNATSSPPIAIMARSPIATPSGSGDVLGNQPLDDHDVEPAAVELGVLLVDADFAEAARAAERATRSIERKDA